MSDREDLSELVRDLRGHLSWLADNGVRELPAPPRPSAASVQAANAPASSSTRSGSLRDAVRSAVGSPSPTRAVAPPPAQAPVAVPRPAANVIPFAPRSNIVAPAQPPPASAPATPAIRRSLEEIRAEIGACQRCKLGKTRTNLVFGVGNPKAELVFVGEGPGADEDAQGIPFVGKAGQLLTKMIEAMGFSRDDVYICNVVKCRPPGNRNPEPDEIEACEPFLKAQLASLSPKVIVALGKFAAQTLLRDTTAITRLRGNWREYCGIRLMPTFHPAYLLRSPAEKAKAWEDLKLVMKVFGKEPPAKKQ